MNTKAEQNTVDISFCLPVYNVRPFLDDCLGSILHQDMEKHGITYEILFVDDGSSDGSFEWLADMAGRIPQMRAERNPENKGVSYTRNRMTREARGKYIWYVDPDDMLIRNAVSVFFALAEKHQADVLLGNYIRVPEDAAEGDEYVCSENADAVEVRNTKREAPRDRSGRTMSAIWAGMFRKDFLLDNDLSMNENMVAQEDTLFYYEYGLKTQKVFKCDVECYLYRQRESSVMNTRNDQRARRYYRSMVEMLRVYRAHMSAGDFDDRAILEEKIHHSRQNVTQCLASIHDKAFIKEQMKGLKTEGVYPYPFRKAALKMRPWYLGFLTYMLPWKPFFWLYHYIYVARH